MQQQNNHVGLQATNNIIQAPPPPPPPPPPSQQPPLPHKYFELFKNKWNTSQEIVDTLYAAQSDPQSQCITTHVLPRPSSGTQIIYPRYDGSWFKNDEFVWRRRKEGKLIREDHMKLKLHKQQVISANYVHSAIVPTFHRRVYWLTDSPTFVLVHYLNESNIDRGIQKTAQTIAECLQSNNVHLSHAQLVEQLTPIYAHCLKVDEVQILVNAVLEATNLLCQNTKATSSVSNNSPMLKNDQSFKIHRQYQLERRNSCSSAFRRGLSSMALRRQPSANSEIDANHIGTMMKKYGCGGSPNEKYSTPPHCNCDPSTSSALESRSQSGETEIRSCTQDEDISIYHQQASVKSSLNNSFNDVLSKNCNGNVQKTRKQTKIKTTNDTNGSSTSTTTLTPIIEVSPTSSSSKGGQKCLIIGAWYMKGHRYKVSVGECLVEAKLIQAGVLSIIIPPALTTEQIVLIQVFCNEQPVSTTFKFRYTNNNENQDDELKRVDEISHQIFEKLRILAYALDIYHIFETSEKSITCDELRMNELVQKMDQQIVANNCLSVIHEKLLKNVSDVATKTILHLIAAVDFDRLFETVLILSRRLEYFREFDLIARDAEGCTPLHLAARHGSIRVARLIVGINRTTLDVLDDRGRTPSDLAENESQIGTVLNVEKNLSEGVNRHVNATELWVLTNGETVTREHLLLSKLSKTAIGENKETSSCSMMSEINMQHVPHQFSGTSRDNGNDDESMDQDRNDEDEDDEEDEDEDDDNMDDEKLEKSQNEQLHVEISMDTDVHVPDSPKMARLFHVVTSPGVVVTDNARAKMADLARQIIDALPDRIKNNSDGIGSFFEEEDDESRITNGTEHLGAFTTQHNPMLSHNTISCETSMDSSCHVADDFYDMMVAADSRRHSQHLHSLQNSISEPRSNETAETNRSTQLFASSHDDRSFVSSSTRANTFESDTLDFDKDLGEFFTIHLDASIDPIQQRLANLKYNDDEQRDVYEAAMVIQRAYREYRARNTSRRQEDIERRAALKIQGCYRRYKQFCYFKKLHNAAIVVQKHFRMRKKDDKEESSAVQNVPEHPTLDGQSIRIQVPQNKSTLLREHRAATTIQLAYRGHRKRQAAARKIQNFMRQSRNKLRKMHAQNEDGSLCVQSDQQQNQELVGQNQMDQQHQQQQQQLQQQRQQQMSCQEKCAPVIMQLVSLPICHQTMPNGTTVHHQIKSNRQPMNGTN